MKPTHSPGTRLLPTVAAVASLYGAVCLPAAASSHREAPFIAMNPTVDATDLYMFRSYETGPRRLRHHPRELHPVPGSAGRPELLHVQPERAVRDPHRQQRRRRRGPDVPVPLQEHVEGDRADRRRQAVKIPLINSGADQRRQPGCAERARDLHASTWCAATAAAAPRGSVTNASRRLEPSFDKPVDNIGDKTFGSADGYATYANQHIYNVTIPGCATAGQGVRRPAQGAVLHRRRQDLRPLQPEPARARRSAATTTTSKARTSARSRSSCRSPA